MFKQVNQNAKKENRWPCMVCDEWSWDVLS